MDEIEKQISSWNEKVVTLIEDVEKWLEETEPEGEDHDKE